MTDKRKTVLIVLVLLAFLSFGCFDLTAVPGVSVSPDGSQIYFLSGSLMEGSTGALTSLNLSSGQTETILASSDEVLVSAFDVNPANGDVAFVQSSQTTGSTSIMLYNPAAGPRELAVLPGTGAGTMLEFSPDGSHLGVTYLSFPPEALASMNMDLSVSPSTDGSGTQTLPPEILAQIKSTAYVVDANSGEATPISDPAKEWANTLTWNPSGSLIAYNAWVDSDGNGKISSLSFLTAMQSGGTGDLGEIHVYEVAGGTNTAVGETTSINFSPEFVSDSSLAYVSINTMMAMSGGGLNINLYDLSSGSSTPVHQAKGLVFGISLSPDGSQVAWTESGETNAAAGTGGDSQNTPSYLFAAEPGFANVRQVAELSSSSDTAMFLVDVPVWMPDGSAVLISSTDALSSIMGSLAGSMGGLMEAIATPSAGDSGTAAEAMPSQQILKIAIASGESSVVYEGTMTNSNFMATMLGLSTGDLESMAP